MADVAIRKSGVSAVPNDYLIPGAQEIVLRSVSAVMDGTSAAVAWFPCLEILDPSGNVLVSAVANASVAAGASADVSWFPGVTPATSGGGGSGIQFDTDPQSGDWLVVTTTGTNPTTGDGVRFTDTGFGGIEFFTTGFSGDLGGVYMESDSTSNGNPPYALVTQANNTGSATTAGIRTDGLNTTGTGTAYGVIANADGNATGGATGIAATGSVSGSGGSSIALGGDFTATQSGTGNQGGTGIRTIASGKGSGTGLGADLVASGTNGSTGDHVGAKITAKSAVGFTGTLYGLQVFIGTTKVFQINSDGSLHGLTGQSLTFDL